MDPKNQRLRYLREEVLHLSRKAFGAPIGMSDSEIKNIEYGITALKDAKIPLISQAYSVSADWLRDGIGDIQMPEAIHEKIGRTAASAAQRDPEAARRFFTNIYNQIGEDGLLLLYEILRPMLPDADGEP